MNEELQAVEAAEATQNIPAESAEIQEVAAPEGEHKEPVADDAAKALEATKRRIDRLTADKYRTKAENEQLKAEREQLQRQLAALQGEPNQEQPRLTEQDIQRHARELIETERFNARCDDIAKEGKKAFKAEFDTALQALRQAVPLFTPQGRPEPLMQAILTTDKPHEVLHYLGTNPEVAEDLADLTPLQQARKLALIERDLAGKSTKQTSNAPRPLQPVKAAAGSGEPDAKADPEAWIRWRNQQSRS